jgi:hypothetical protein
MSFTIRGSSYIHDKSHINPEFDNYVEYSKKSNIPSRESRIITKSNNTMSLEQERLTLRVELYARDMSSKILDNINNYIRSNYIGKVKDCKLIHSYTFDNAKDKFLSYAVNNFDKKIVHVNVIAKTFMLKKDDVVEMILSVSEQKAYHTYAICVLIFDKKSTEFVDKKVVVEGVEYKDNTNVYVKILEVNLVDNMVILCKGYILTDKK